MVMNPRTHPRGAPPDFALPRPNPNPERMTDALWWLVCMREALEPALSENGGTFANKPGYHNAGQNLPDHGLGNAKTDHSIRRGPDREGAWWKSKTSAHDWTFKDAQRGDYRTITKYTKRLIDAMRSPTDLRPDNVYAYTLGQIDNDRVVEGYNEYRDGAETSGDETHNWHRHDSFRRNIVGLFAAMWKALTIDMGWTYAEWLRSVTPEEDLPMNPVEFNKLMDGWAKTPTGAAALNGMALNDKIGDKVVEHRTVALHANDMQGVRSLFRFPAAHAEVKAAGYPADAPLVKLLSVPGAIAGIVTALEAVQEELAAMRTALEARPAE